MEGFFSMINDGLVAIDDFIWGVPLMVLILFGGILLTVRLRGVQFRQLPRALRYMIKNETGGEGEVTSFGALCTALSATIGTGNIVGVATAIVAGGPGAMFWMWLAALFGMATKFSEGLLAVKYRSVDKKTGHVLGGPFYYIERGMGMKWRWLAKVFAFFGMCVGLFGIGTFTQVNSISSAITGFFDPEKNATVNILGMDYSIFTVIGSIVLAVLVGLVVIGGLKRIAKVSERVIPAMVVLYVGLSVLLIVTNLDKIPGQTKEPVRQGLVSMTGTFLDTIVVCSMTGLALVMTGAYQIPGLEGAAVTTAAFQAGLPFIPGEVVSFVLMACLVLFGFTTILGWDYYGERCLEYFSNGSMKAVKTYRWLYIAAVFIGPYMTVAAVWTIADIFNGLMALPNMIALIALSGVVVKETKDYFARLAAAGNEDEMAPHLPGDNWDIPPIDPLDDRLGAAN